MNCDRWKTRRSSGGFPGWLRAPTLPLRERPCASVNVPDFAGVPVSWGLDRPRCWCSTPLSFVTILRARSKQTIAHELKHYIQGDDKKALYAAIFMIIGGLAVLSFGSAFAVRVSGGRWGFDRISDPASVPLLALIALVISLVAAAGFHAYGHHIEQEADRFSLDLTHDRVAQAALMQRLLSCSRLRNRMWGGFRRHFDKTTPRSATASNRPAAISSELNV
jgi:hypothetical protein